MIIGISGTIGSGKDTVAKYLIKKGFQHISLSDVLRQKAKKQKISLERDSIRTFSNTLTADELAKEAITLKTKNNAVFSSIRKPAEVDYLRGLPDFKLIFVDAPIKLRFQRMKERARADEKNLTLDDLKGKEKIEMSGQSSQRLDYCKEKADFKISNSSDLNYLHQQVERILNAAQNSKE